MVNIKKTYDLNKNLTTFKITGQMMAGDLYDCLAQYFGGKVTLRTLWDITEAQIPSATVDEISDLAQYVRNMADARMGGKTAIISKDDLGYGMSRMLGTLYELEQVPFEIQVFRSLEDARAWIGVGGSHDDEERVKINTRTVS